MKVQKWVDFGQDVTVDIGLDDVRAAIAEAFEVVTRDRFEESGPNRNDVLIAIDSLGKFLKALTDAQIALLSDEQRKVVSNFLTEQSKRFGGA
jgi:hypothetical protein